MAEFEERADQLSLKIIDETLADGQIFQRARQKLLGPGAKLLVGPRGTGKTHVMRYTYLQAIQTATAPIAIYASFNRYLNLEPLLRKSPDALKRFHSWVLAKLLLSSFTLLADAQKPDSILTSLGDAYDQDSLLKLVALLERGSGADIYEAFGQNLTIGHVLGGIEELRRAFGRKRAIVLLDDAALSLTSEYLIAFFEVYRLLKTELISPKASVYPGSTQYGPTFHASHESEEVPLWLSVDDADYSTIMGDIAARRMTATEIQSINPDTLETFKFIAFGIPRAYLRLLREYVDTTAGSAQQKVNRIVEQQAQLIGAEYDSLGIKLKQFGSVVSVGRRFFDKLITSVAEAQPGDPTKNLIVGLRQSAERNPLSERMLKFLVEVGMLYPLQAVSHGQARKYDRFIPHLAFLYQSGVFREGRGSSLKDVPAYMLRGAAKHPIRRDLTSLLTPDEMVSLKLDLPPCPKCATGRINESQRFCHNCGAELVAASLFEQCMQLPLEGIPGVSSAMIHRIHSETSLRTIGHVYASQNASADLQQASYVGPKRAAGIIGKVALVVEEFLS
jgi:hypothetical protein